MDSEFTELPDDLMIQLNQTCNRFEEQWQDGKAPMVEEWIEQVSPALRRESLRELLLLEIAFRQQDGAALSIDQYKVRFPELDEPILAELRAALEAQAAEGGDQWIVGHYRVEEQLGVGGMGKVYRAHDLALGRDCALKLLTNRFSPTLRARMVLEARTCARLQHPGIASFYEAGEHGDESFIALELVPGQTLRQRLRQGPLATDEAVSLAAALLEAIGHAHAIGILHRDIKPENIMLTDRSTIKLLDFGLAKDVLRNKEGSDLETDIMLTGDGGIVGTVGYMAPEQLRGEPLDERADIFAVGAVLYEALAGKSPFPGKTSTERMAAVLSRDVDPIDRPDVPPDLNSVLRVALYRDSKNRYGDAATFAFELLRIGTGELTSCLPNSFAALDFENLAGAQDRDWIGVGIAETICTRMSRLSSLRVIQRETTKRLREADTKRSLQSLGFQLGCRWLVSGSYQVVENALRISVHLLDVLTGEIVVSEQLDGTCDSIFDLQDEIIELVADKVGQAEGEFPTPPDVQPRFSAYECYVKGRQAWLSTDKGKLDLAEDWFSRAVAMEPTYAPALAGLAIVHSLRYSFTTDANVLNRAESYAQRAIKADPSIGDAHVWLGYIQFHRGNIQAAVECEKRAITLDKDNFQAHYFAGFFHYVDVKRIAIPSANDNPSYVTNPHRQRREHGLRFLQQALELNQEHSFRSWAWLGAGYLHLELEQLAESQWCFEQALELEQQQRGVILGTEGCLGEAQLRAGEYDISRRSCLNGIKALEESDNIYRDTLRAAFLCTLGETAMAQGDRLAASTAFNQAALHARGRNRARSIGHPFVQALCGLVMVGGGQEVFLEAVTEFRKRENFNFDLFWFCSEDKTLLSLARAAMSIDNGKLATEFKSEAVSFGSVEAYRMLG